MFKNKTKKCVVGGGGNVGWPTIAVVDPAMRYFRLVVNTAFMLTTTYHICTSCIFRARRCKCRPGINHKQGQVSLREVCLAHGVFVYWEYLSV